MDRGDVDDTNEGVPDIAELRNPFVNDEWEDTQDFSVQYPDHADNCGGMWKAEKKIRDCHRHQGRGTLSKGRDGTGRRVAIRSK